MATEITSSPEVHYEDRKKSSDKAADTEKIQLEQMETGGYAGKNHTDFSQVDGEVAKYTSEIRTVIDQATNKRLRKLIDRRVLAIMIFTYFLQALDKGTLSFASIMGIQKFTNLVGQEASHSWSSASCFCLQSLVFVADNVYLHCYLDCRVPHKLDHSESPYRKIPFNQHYALGCDIDVPCRCQELYSSCGCPNSSRYLRSMLPTVVCCSIQHVVSEKRTGCYCLVLVRSRYRPRRYMSLTNV